MKLQTSALSIVAVASFSSTRAFAPTSSKSRTSINSLREGLINVELPSIESQVSLFSLSILRISGSKPEWMSDFPLSHAHTLTSVSFFYLL